MRLIRFAPLLVLALLLSVAPARAQENGTVMISATYPASPRAVYMAAFDALEANGFGFRARLLDEALLTLPRRSQLPGGGPVVIVVELEPRGDSTGMTIRGMVVDARGEPVSSSDPAVLAAGLEAQVMVSAAVDSAMDKGGRALKADPREEGTLFGYGRKNPVRVGGGSESGAANQRAYLERLRGPQGQAVRYRRLGSCCRFRSEHAPQGGAIDAYEVTWNGADAPVLLFMDLYTPAPASQSVPDGFTLAPPGTPAAGS